MPLYTFICDNCHTTEEVVRPMSEAGDDRTCKCKHKMRRCFSPPIVLGTNKQYGHSIVSESLAIGEDQIAEHRRMFPDIEVTPDGCPVFDNYAKHDAYLEKTGFMKQVALHNKPHGGAVTTKVYKPTHQHGSWTPATSAKTQANMVSK